MRIAYIEVAGFRGFRTKVRIDMPEGFVVLTGRNGAGKSTLLDAFDFVLSGSIGKFASKGGKGGGLEQHLWWAGEGLASEYYAEVGFVERNGHERMVRRDILGTLSDGGEEVLRALCTEDAADRTSPETVVRTTLVRDELIAAHSLDLPGPSRFSWLRDAIGETNEDRLLGRIESLKLAAQRELEQQDKKVDALKVQLTAENGRLATTRAKAAGSSLPGTLSDGAMGEGSFGNEEPPSPDWIRREVARRRQRLEGLRQLRLRFERWLSKEREVRTRVAPEVVVDLEGRIDAGKRAVEECETRQTQAEAWVQAELRVDAMTQRLSSLLEHGSELGLQEGGCPLCGLPQDDERFKHHLTSIRGQLASKGSQLPAAMEAQRAVRQQLIAERARLQEAERQFKGLNDRLQAIVDERAVMDAEARDLAITLDGGIDALLATQSSLEGELKVLSERLAAIESSEAAVQLREIETGVERLRRQIEAESNERAVRQRVLEDVDSVSRTLRVVANEVLEEQFDAVLPVLRELYQRLRPHGEWRELDVDFGGKVRASLNLSVGAGKNPQFMFSSGQRRAAGLAFLLALHLARPWARLRTLLLDDPVQHIDDYRALNLVEVLAAIRRTGRQIIVAVEDEALADLLCRRLGVGGSHGRRFEVGVGADGGSAIIGVRDVPPMPGEVLWATA